MLLYCGLLLNLTPPLIGARTIIRVLKERGQVFTASANIVERFGLFTIIVLAESILSTVTAISRVKDKQPAVWMAFILALLIAFLLWNLYFDMTSEQQTKKGYSYMQWITLLHFPLLASLDVVGACIKVVLADIETGLPNGFQWMFCIALSIILLMIVGITNVMEEEEEDRAYIKPVARLLVVTAVCMFLIPLFGKSLSTLKFFTVIAVVLCMPVFIGVRSWAQYKFFNQD
ncbi:MAG: low temperature requirement protein A [Chitinophagales bacterium]